MNIDCLQGVKSSEEPSQPNGSFRLSSQTHGTKDITSHLMRPKNHRKVTFYSNKTPSSRHHRRRHSLMVTPGLLSSSNKVSLKNVEVVCLLHDPGKIFPVPRGANRVYLANQQLIGAVVIVASMTPKEVRDAIASIFWRPFQLESQDSFSFSYLSFLTGSKRLHKPQESASHEWGGREVIRICKRNNLYIMCEHQLKTNIKYFVNNHGSSSDNSNSSQVRAESNSNFNESTACNSSNAYSFTEDFDSHSRAQGNLVSEFDRRRSQISMTTENYSGDTSNYPEEAVEDEMVDDKRDLNRMFDLNGLGTNKERPRPTTSTHPHYNHDASESLDSGDDPLNGDQSRDCKFQFTERIVNQMMGRLVAAQEQTEMRFLAAEEKRCENERNHFERQCLHDKEMMEKLIDFEERRSVADREHESKIYSMLASLVGQAGSSNVRTTLGVTPNWEFSGSLKPTSATQIFTSENTN